MIKIPDLIDRALTANRESKQIEFKSTFDPTSPGEWCEIVKDIVAIANSGGGIILFGVNSDGTRSGSSVDVVGQIDPADLTNKVSKYTGCVDPAVEIQDVLRGGCKVPAFIIGASSIPLVFERPGSYEIEPGKQKTAFGLGTIYFRHGAKSEPGTFNDIRSFFDRQVSAIRQSWLKQVRRVSKAPIGSEVVIAPAGTSARGLQNGAVVVVKNDPMATHVVLTRNKDAPGGTFMHEEVSEGIFDEINNVVDANRILAGGKSKFFLGPAVYYRVYAERQRIKQKRGEIELLFRTGACEFYAPNLFWAAQLDDDSIAKVLESAFLAPKSPQIHWFMRFAVLLGSDFCNWLSKKWNQKWSHASQPPSFYFSFAEMISDINVSDLRLIATRSSLATTYAVPGEPDCSCSALLADARKADLLLSSACMAIFEGNGGLRTSARELDYLAHGAKIIKRGDKIAKAAIKAIAGRPPGEFRDSARSE